MGLFKIFGGNDDSAELRTTQKALLSQLKNKDRVIEELEERLEDIQHEKYRGHKYDVRNLQERLSDQELDYKRDLEKMSVDVRKSKESYRETLEADTKQAIKVKDIKIEELLSKIRTLELAADEEMLDVDLQVQEGINEYRDQYQQEVTALTVKVARLEGEVKAANAETKSKDAIIEILKKQLEIRSDDVESFMEFASDVAPKVNLEKFAINVEVPAPVTVTQKGGEQQKKQ